MVKWYSIDHHLESENGGETMGSKIRWSCFCMAILLFCACSDNEPPEDLDDNNNEAEEEPEEADEDNSEELDTEEAKRMVFASLDEDIDIDESSYIEEFEHPHISIIGDSLVEGDSLSTFEYNNIVYDISNIDLYEIEVEEEELTTYSANEEGNLLISYDVIAYNQNEQRERVMIPHLDVKIDGHTIVNEGLIGPSVLYTELRPRQAKVIRNHIIVAHPLEEDHSIDVGVGYEFITEHHVGREPRLTIFGEQEESVDYDEINENDLSVQFSEDYYMTFELLEEEYELSFGETILQHTDPIVFDEGNGIAARVNKVEVREVDTSENEELGSSNGRKIALLVDKTYFNKTIFPFGIQKKMLEFEIGGRSYGDDGVTFPPVDEYRVVDSETALFNRELIIYDLSEGELENITIKLSSFVNRQLSEDDSEYEILEN